MLGIVAGTVLATLFWKRRERLLRRNLGELHDEVERLREQHQHELIGETSKREVLFNSMAEGVLVLDSNDRVQLVNPALERLFDIQNSILGCTVMEAFRLHELQNLVERTLREGHVLGFELMLPGFEDRCLQVNATALVEPDGRRRGMLLVFHDLTRLKQLENTRKDFVANVSHELRTPLSMIKGYVETLIDGAKDDPVVAKRFLHTIQKHANRLNYLIEDLLTISRLEFGHVVMNLDRVELAPLVERTLEELGAKARQRSIMLSHSVPANLQVKADADRLLQVFFNLIDNAIKYGKQGGAAEVGAKNLEEKKSVEVWVKDDGPGIPPEAIERVFERFYRVDRARSREQGGTGLGLSIVKHIIQSHGGEVWVESGQGKGTTFHFTLQGA